MGLWLSNYVLIIGNTLENFGWYWEWTWRSIFQNVKKVLYFEFGDTPASRAVDTRKNTALYIPKYLPFSSWYLQVVWRNMKLLISKCQNILRLCLGIHWQVLVDMGRNMTFSKQQSSPSYWQWGRLLWQSHILSPIPFSKHCSSQASDSTGKDHVRSGMQ